MSNLVVKTESLAAYNTLSRGFIAPPPGKLYLLCGDPAVFRISLALASRALLGGTSIAIIDGCNRFDAHSIAHFARERKIDPQRLLNRIHISRGFTCYQMEAAVNSKLIPFLKRIDAHTALIFGLLDTFYDEQARFQEVRQILRRIMEKLHEMKSTGISVLLVSQEYNVRPTERNQLMAALKRGMDQVYRVEMNEEQKPKLFLEDRSEMLSSGNMKLPSKQLMIP
jgi:hypothetical protein